MELNNQNLIEQRRLNSRRYSTKYHSHNITQAHSRSKLQTEVCILPPIILNSQKGFVRLKTICLKDIYSAQSVFNIVRDNSESVEKYKSEFHKRQRHNSVHDDIKNTSIVNYSRRLSKNISPIKGKKAKLQQKLMSDILKIRINPKCRESVKKIKQTKHKLEEDRRLTYAQSLEMNINVQKLNSLIKSPECRQGSQIWVDDKKVYLLGGHSRNNKHFIENIDLKRKEWSKLEIDGYRRRSFHSCIVIKKQIYQLFGFQQPGIMEHRRLSAEIDIINIETRSIRKLKVPSQVKPRFEQSACLYSSSFIIVSGGRTLGDYLNDCFFISLLSEDVKLVGDLPFESGLAGHTMCMTNQNLYLFGGRSGNGDLSNKMLCFSAQKNRFTELKTHGVPPIQCYGHSMHYLKQPNLLLIYGGKNDNMANPFLNQVVLFNQQLSTYYKMNSLQGEWFGNDGFYAFPATHCDKNIVFIYGGINLKGINNSIYLIDFDVKKKKQLESQNN